ncbi:MAG: class I SAM-dependent methyltransferase [Thermodesulfovibrionales bacterium]|nr:class I SAM-dependent methyltransferase [Thermodesulfovibrionales bacterium]MDP3113021.1 class I SAM-dependent methyltransferase [Thermodesulfovibrionales bacterium]
MSAIMNEAKELMKLWGGFRASRVLLTANNYRVFDFLTKAISAKEISKRLKTDIRATEILLDALTGIGLLKKHKNIYSNAPLASKFLVSGKPYYQGDILRHANTLWQNWSGLDEVMKTGKPYRKAHDHKSFILGMHNLALLKAKDIVKQIGLKGIKTALDLGGGPGTYSIEMAKNGVDVTLFDRPETVEIAKRIVNNSPQPPLNLRGGINFIQGDFINDNIGNGYDLIFASQILHSGSEKDNIQLLKKCRKALNRGGRMVIQEFYILKDRAHPLPGALFSVNMLVNTPGGRCYSPDEMKKWLLKAGFKKTEEKVLGDTVLVQAVNK